MKVYLIYNMDDEWDRERHKDAMNGAKYKNILEDFGNYLRNQRKYVELPKQKAEYLQEITDMFYHLQQDSE